MNYYHITHHFTQFNAAISFLKLSLVPRPHTWLGAHSKPPGQEENIA
jgi:hypothetical protein